MLFFNNNNKNVLVTQLITPQAHQPYWMTQDSEEYTTK